MISMHAMLLFISLQTSTVSVSINLSTILKTVEMNTRKSKYINYLWMTGVALCFFLHTTSCVNDLLPDTQEAFDRETNYTQQIYRPVLGRTTLFSNNFESGNSTLPFTFEITRIVKADGS